MSATTSRTPRRRKRSAMLRELGKGETEPRKLALLEEAARIADRLDELDRVIAGKGVLQLMRFRLHEHWGEEGDRTVSVEVKFDSVLSEARQQAAVLRSLLVTLGVGRLEGKRSGGSILDQLAAQREGAAGPSSPDEAGVDD